MLLNERLGWSSFLVFLLNIISCASLVKSGLKIIFYWKAQLLTTDQRDASAKSLKFKGTSFDKSLMQIKNNNGPIIDPSGTLALTLSGWILSI